MVCIKVEFMKLDITRQEIKAKTRTLKANWSIHPTLDLPMATTPWQYVKNWSMSDKGPHDTLETLNERMLNRWPGKYKIVVEQKWNGLNYYINEYNFKFDTPKDETWFRLQYS